MTQLKLLNVGVNVEIFNIIVDIKQFQWFHMTQQSLGVFSSLGFVSVHFHKVAKLCLRWMSLVLLRTELVWPCPISMQIYSTVVVCHDIEFVCFVFFITPSNTGLVCFLRIVLTRVFDLLFFSPNFSLDTPFSILFFSVHFFFLLLL